uniref:Uncharacterized protein n=1 Tax=Chromera velia CCMP2878 TaxID=1169474 RepID=A0A0G4I5F4_9ALVE|eukprot:Cvel_11155.t1-p1 / transcript=Cvel_11155.t1 / gene=Cvel_11155 / organism=Chromera_velia_CCMP2878 / gene_product=hypothetical protein / transcript_product=hypothetical protein / location=Cvel_scaffold692:15178-18999(+) / protein_length=461 / sequence_SO=supercontig / SO=protein_coding / is_pseudo=false
MHRLTNIREKRRQELEKAKQEIFGYACGMPGEKWFTRPLEGRDFQNWYYPSKYKLQDFRIEEYMEAQALRFQPPALHPCVGELQKCLKEIQEKRDGIREFLGMVDRETFEAHVSIQDLYGLYRTLYPGDANVLGFEVEGDTEALRPSSTEETAELPEESRGKGFDWESSVNLNSAEEYLKHRLAEGVREGGERLKTQLEERLSSAGSEAERRSVLLSFLTHLEAGDGGEKETTGTGSSSSSSSLEGFGDSLPLIASGSGASSVLQFRSLKQKVKPWAPKNPRGREGGKDAKPMARFALERTEEDVVRVLGTEGEGEEDEGLVPASFSVSANASATFSASSPKEENPPGVITEVPLTLAPAVRETERLLGVREAASEFLEHQCEEDSREGTALKSARRRHHRFVDPLYRRRRLVYLERLARDRVKSVKEKKYKEHFTTPPDKQKCFPTEKGALQGSHYFYWG